MKKIFAFVVVIQFFIISFSQQIPKKYVLVEFATGTWCPFCPGASMGAQDLVNNGHNVAIIKYHGGDPFSNTDGNSRLSYYSDLIPGYPTAIFNGLDTVVGGNHSNSMYSSYLPLYNSAITQTSSFYCEIDTIYTNNDKDFSAQIKVKKVANYSGTNIKLHLALTESNIDYSWQGQSQLHYLLRKMYPSAIGITIDFSEGDSLTFYYEFTVDKSWKLANLELIAFLQDDATKEILQTDKYTNLDIVLGQNDVMLYSIDNPSQNEVICNNVISPVFTVKNKGLETLTSFDVYLNINGTFDTTFNVTDNIASLQTRQIFIDPITFELQQNDTLTISVQNPNGQLDANEANNTKKINFEESKHTTNKVFLRLNTAKWGQYISYSLYYASNQKIDTSGALSAYTIVLDTFNVELNECYVFKLWDKISQGFHSSDGYCLLYDKFTDTLFFVSGNFGKKTEFQFKPTQESPVDIINFDNLVKIYPNPSNDFIEIQLPEKEKYNICLYSITGKEIYNFEVFNSYNLRLNVSDLAKGIYLLQIKNSKSTFNKSIIKK